MMSVNNSFLFGIIILIIALFIMYRIKKYFNNKQLQKNKNESSLEVLEEEEKEE